MNTFTEAELRVLLSVLTNLNWKTADARVILPIIDKIDGLIPKPVEQPKETDAKPAADATRVE